MAGKFDALMTRDRMYKCFPEEIEIRPELNGRQEKPDIEWLIADMLSINPKTKQINGQIQPVSIWDDGGTPVLALGFSRWRAIAEINKRKLTPVKMQIKCVYINCNEQGAFLRNISENRMRNPTTPFDDAHNIQRLFEWTMSEEDVAKVYFPTAATQTELKDAIKWIRERVNLVKLTPEAEAAMKDGRLNETAAQALSKLSSAQQKEAIKTGRLTAKEIKASAPKKPRKTKAAAIDPELRRRVTAVVETADWDEANPKATIWVQVNAEFLSDLAEYVKEK